MVGRAFAGKTVFLTGDTGFKGSWLAAWLLELGAHVVGYALPPRGPEENFVACGLDRRISHLDGDVRDHGALAAAMRSCEPEVAFHLAAQALVLESYAEPRQTFDTNVMGTVNFMEALRDAPSVRAAVVITSDKCYEDRDWCHGYRENDRLGGADPYSASKGAAELVVASMRRSFFTEEGAPLVATARAGNVIGGGDWGEHRIIPDCIRALQAGRPIEIRHPRAVRPWQHVLEALGGYLTLGAGLLAGDASLAGPWNFGPLPSHMVPVRRLVDEVIDAWGGGNATVLPEHPDQPQEARFLHLDISKALHRLGWAPRLTFQETVAWTVAGYRAQGESAQDVLGQRTEQIRAYQERSDG